MRHLFAPSALGAQLLRFAGARFRQDTSREQPLSKAVSRQEKAPPHAEVERARVDYGVYSSALLNSLMASLPPALRT